MYKYNSVFKVCCKCTCYISHNTCHCCNASCKRHCKQWLYRHHHNYKQSETSPHETPCMKLCSLRYRKYIKPYYYNCNYYNRIHSAYTCMLPFFFLYTTTPHVPAIHMKSPSHAPDDAPAVLIHSCPSLPNCALICLKSLTSQPSF